MMRLVSGWEMKKMDAWTSEEWGLPSRVLMENAGRAVVEKTKRLLGSIRQKQVVILAGKGNNGGDALVAARHLYEQDCDVRLFLVFHPDRFSGDALENWKLLAKTGLKHRVLEDENSLYLLKLSMGHCDLLLDGIFGTGFRGRPDEKVSGIIEAVNESRCPVLSIDIPSGLDSDTGNTGGLCIQATYTVTFAYAKRGLVLYPGRLYTGELEVAHISLPAAALSLVTSEMYYADLELACCLLPGGDVLGHKNSFGHVLVVAGSQGMTGAAYLAAKAVLRAGAGLVTVCLPHSLADGFDASLPEALTCGVAETEERSISRGAWPRIKEILSQKNAVVFGPGLTRNREVRVILENMISELTVPLVIDADGLNVLAQDTAILNAAKAPVILTPHPGEMGRLLGVPAREVLQDKLHAAEDAAAKFKAVIALKGADTITATPEGKVYINSTGSQALATAGTGDVLAGAVGSFLAQGLNPEAAVVLGVYTHGLAGDIKAREKGVRGVLAGDVIEALPYALSRIREERTYGR